MGRNQWDIRARVMAAIAAVIVMSVSLAARQDDRGLVRQAPAERRVALVVGNDTYPQAALQNARNDARSVAVAMEELGFTVTLVEDASREALGEALAGFGERLQPGDVALFYYAGHGVQIDQENYLVPVDFKGQSAMAARFNLVKVSDVQQTFDRARVSLLVLDACRNNPFTGARGGSGLAPMVARGGLIAFATGPGQTASDNAAAGNGLFTSELLKVLREPGLTVQEVFRRVREGVDAASQGRQRPALYEDVVGELVLRQAPATAANAPIVPGAAPSLPTPPPVATSDAELSRREELLLWESIRDSKNPRVFDDYLKRYPTGAFRVAAEARLEDLRTPPAPAATPAPPPPSAPGAVAAAATAAESAAKRPDTATAKPTTSVQAAWPVVYHITTDGDCVLTDFRENDARKWIPCFCFGTLYVTDAAIGFKGTDVASHDWQVPLSRVTEAKRNGVVWKQYGGFHIKLASGDNFNFIPADRQRELQAPEPILAAILQAVNTPRK